MRVVHLTTEFPWPATSGGPVRTLSQLRIIASLPEVESITLLSVTEQDVPASDVRALEGAVEITGGGEHQCARFASGAVKCWGNNSLDQLGDGSDPEDIVELRGLLYGLYAILRLHNAQEEETAFSLMPATAPG